MRWRYAQTAHQWERLGRISAEEAFVLQAANGQSRARGNGKAS